jgi:catechol 2,3-dioxygenase-like lactoylglutathione lyase family enzyme
MRARDPSVRRVVIDHINLPVRDLAASRTFYEAVLATLGFGVQESEGWVAFGPPGSEDFCLVDGDPGPAGTHVAFAAASREEVHAFHAAALAAGATDNGTPGTRETYSPTYYAAFVLDPDGHNIEAVFHEPTDGVSRRRRARR